MLREGDMVRVIGNSDFEGGIFHFLSIGERAVVVAEGDLVNSPIGKVRIYPVISESGEFQHLVEGHHMELEEAEGGLQ